MKLAHRNRKFNRVEFVENLLKFTPIWELELTNFSSDSKIYESYLAKFVDSHEKCVIDCFFRV